MREHDHDSEADLQPKSDRVERDGDELMYRAANAGRRDVLGASGLLGLQRIVGNAGVGALMDGERSPVHDVVGSGGGQPLDVDTRREMESRFGQDFSHVRIHTDEAAHESARSLNAQAYTVGSDIVFQHDRYDPSSADGRHTLAHELTHVVQQRSGPVGGADVGGGVKVSDPSDRFEHEAVATADHVMSSEPTALASASGAHAVQRLEDGEMPREQDPEVEEDGLATAQTYVQRHREDEHASSVTTLVQRQSHSVETGHEAPESSPDLATGGTSTGALDRAGTAIPSSPLYTRLNLLLFGGDGVWSRQQQAVADLRADLEHGPTPPLAEHLISMAAAAALKYACGEIAERIAEAVREEVGGQSAVHQYAAGIASRVQHGFEAGGEWAVEQLGEAYRGDDDSSLSDFIAKQRDGLDRAHDAALEEFTSTERTAALSQDVRGLQAAVAAAERQATQARSLQYVKSLGEWMVMQQRHDERTHDEHGFGLLVPSFRSLRSVLTEAGTLGIQATLASPDAVDVTLEQVDTQSLPEQARHTLRNYNTPLRLFPGRVVARLSLGGTEQATIIKEPQGNVWIREGDVSPWLNERWHRVGGGRPYDPGNGTLVIYQAQRAAEQLMRETLGHIPMRRLFG
jgi:hypothetical protein